MPARGNGSRSARPTIKDVARLAGVSQCTVSYVLNNNPAALRFSAQTKQRVHGAVSELGYQFNPIGRALQRGYTNQVTLLIVSWNLATSHAATAMAISQAAVKQDLALTVHVADDDAAAESFLRRSMLHNLGGVLVLWDSPALQLSALRQLALDGVPVVDLLPGSADAVSVVTADREEAGFRATQHLLSLGHRNIALIGDTITRPQTTLRKLAGYRRALATQSIPFQERFVENVTEFGFEGGQTGVRRLLKQSPEITALFCINDEMALGAIDAAAEFGLRCPRDLSVVGFGDAAMGRHWRPKLTTIALASDRVAHRAIQLIIEQRRQPGFIPQSILIPEDLVLRESTGTAPMCSA